MQDRNKWLPIYIYCNPSPEKILVHFIRPLARRLLKEKLILQYFFIRYYDYGYHIRFRVKLAHDTSVSTIKKLIVNDLQSFIDEFPDLVYFYRFAEYEPETERYGGLHALQCSERHFQDSSEILLKMIAQRAEWTYDAALSTALTLHLSFLYAAGLTYQDASTLVDNITNSWFTAAVKFLVSTANTSLSMEEAAAKIDTAFNTSYERQRPGLNAFCVRLWTALQAGEPCFQGSDKWLRRVRKTHAMLGKMAVSGNLILQPHYAAHPQATGTVEEQITILYESYFHMTNNRLGLANSDEAFIGFLLSKILETLQIEGILTQAATVNI